MMIQTHPSTIKQTPKTLIIDNDCLKNKTVNIYILSRE